MDSPATTVTKPATRVLPIALLACSVLFLFVEPRLVVLFPNGIPAQLTMTWTKAAHITDAQGSIVSLDNAISSGWVTVDPRMEFGRVSGFTISNKTDKPFRLQFLTKKYSFPELETVSIPAGTTQAVEKPQTIYPASEGAGLDDKARAIMRVTVTILLLGGGLFVILAKERYTATDRHWAYGTLGTIVGYWLKG